MKRKIKTWVFRLVLTTAFIAVLLVVIILNPVLTYANKTAHNNYNIFHNQALNISFLQQLEQANDLVKSSEFYDPSLKLDICLNDGSIYPTLIHTIKGDAFAWGFYNKVVMRGHTQYSMNNVALHGYKWNFTQLLAHEIVHCLQYNKLGFWHSKPYANIPNWKWEGYAEYVARQGNDQNDLRVNIERLEQAESDSWAIVFSDSTIAPREYYHNWILTQFCINVKKMSYMDVLADTTSRQNVSIEMMKWYLSHPPTDSNKYDSKIER